MSKWISVYDRLPDEGTVVLAAGKRSATTGEFQGTVLDKKYWYWKGSIKTVTHWMPLPPIPKES